MQFSLKKILFIGLISFSLANKQYASIPLGNSNSSIASISEVNIVEYFKNNLSEKKIYYIPNPGNAGDALIWFGTFQLMNKLNLNVYHYGKKSDSKFDQVYEDFDVLIMGGGGGLPPYHKPIDIVAETLTSLMKKFKQIILLPHTIRAHEKLLNSIESNVILFCRDTASYDYCKNLVKYPQNILFSSDMAFYADYTPFYKFDHLKTDLFAFRTDREVHPNRKSIVLPKINRDISKIGYITPSNSIEQNVKLVHDFLSVIADYQCIWTDRLHVAIAGFMLGKKVFFYDNSYRKNEAVYYSSIAPRDLSHNVKFFGSNFESLKLKIKILEGKNI